MNKYNKNYVKFIDGDILHVDDFNKIYPMSMIENSILKIEICEFLATNYYGLVKKSLEWKILVNILSSKSHKIRMVTILILISRQKNIEEINIDFIDSKFKNFFNKNIYFLYEDSEVSYIDSVQVFNSIIKFFINHLFRFFRNNKIKKNSSVIRAWTDLDKELHNDYFNDSTIYIYPFGINIIRSLKFIKKTFIENKNSSLMGINYSFKKLIKIIISKNRYKDLSLFEYELAGMESHSKDFLYFQVIYTSDEYISAIPVLYSNLIKQDKKIINIAHGIGIYNPYNIYTKFYLKNEFQKNFYLKFENNLEYGISEVKYIRKDSILNNNLETVIVFIHQANLLNYRLLYEKEFQERILFKLNNILLSKIYIKLHPNTKVNEKNEILSKYQNIIEIKEFDLSKYNYTFLTMFSSAYYDLNRFGKFVFLEDNIFSPKKMFNNINLINYEELEYFIKKELTYNEN